MKQWQTLISQTKIDFPLSRYYGQAKPENLLFNANLQEFTRKVDYITGLETSGKLSPLDAYKQIKALWKKLKQAKEELLVGQEPPTSP